MSRFFRRAVGLAAMLSLIVAGVNGTAAGGGGETGAAAQQPAAIPAARQAQNVAVISIDRQIDAVMARSVQRRIDLAAEEGADAIVFDLDTPGGEVGAVLEICNAIKSSPIVNTVAWVNPDAYSGGALIALACREIVVNDPASMGDAAPIQISFGILNEMAEDERQKVLAPLLAEVVDSARRNGYDELLVQGMVSRGVELWLIEHRETGERLFVGPEEYRLVMGEQPARGTPRVPSAAGGDAPRRAPDRGDAAPARPQDADATDFIPGSPTMTEELRSEITFQQEIASTRPVLTSADRGEWRLVEYVADGRGLITLRTEDLLRYGLASAKVRNEEQLKDFFGAQYLAYLNESWSERMVAFLTNPIVRGVLIVVFLVALFLELTSPGLILPGTVAAAALFTLLIPPFLNDMATWWEVAAIVVGLACIGVEILVLPGFGVFGVIGLLLLFGGLVGTFMHTDGGIFPDSPKARHDMLYGVLTIVLSSMTAGVAIYFLSKHFHSLPLVGRLVLTEGTPEESDAGTLLGAMAPVRKGPASVGEEGTAVTPLRPGGRVEIGDRMVDVVADIGFIPAGARVRVTQVEGFRVSVEPAADDATQPDDGPANGGARA